MGLEATEMNTPLVLYSRESDNYPAESLVRFNVSWQPRLMSVYSSQTPVGAPVKAAVFLSPEEAKHPLLSNLIHGVVQAQHGWRGYVQLD
jgi:hypothetical protein